MNTAGRGHATLMYLIWLGLATLVLVGGILMWLKGTYPTMRHMLSTLVRRSGEPWTWMVFVEPIVLVPYVIVSAAVGLAHPDSHWARWFYGEQRMQRARQRYSDEGDMVTPHAAS